MRLTRPRLPRRLRPYRRMLAAAGRAIFALVLLFAAGELLCRIRYPAIVPYPLQLDLTLGWRLRENVIAPARARDADGRRYRFTCSTVRDGFKLYGSGRGRRLLVIGDSFTEGFNLPADHIYAAVIRDLLPAEVFVCGVGGYSTLQEYLVLDAQLDTIRPDLVLWQFCHNDFINNSFALELQSTINHLALPRPYLQEDGSIRFAIPSRFAASRQLVMSHSRLLFFLWSRLDRLNAMRLVTVENDIYRDGAGHPGFRRAADITATILRMVRKRCGSLPVCLFVSEQLEPYDTEIRRIAGTAGIRFIDGVPAAIAAAAAAGETVFNEDGSHWNGAGHRIAGTVLARQLQRHLVDGNRTPLL